MPRRTRKGSLLKSKPQLLFLEPPVDGATHHYGPQVRSALNPRSFLSEQRTSNSEHSSWVTPQFDSSMQLQCPVRRRGGGTRKSLGSSVLDRSLLLSLPQLRKTSVCKFPPLSFEKHVAPQPRPQTSTRGDRTNHPPTGALQERLCLLFPLTPLGTQSPPDVLVSDTPEQDYGLRVSRRRRRRRFLQD
ncbi:RAD9, HUS1, RAD1-interacting nuclear orphan protein 1 [Megalops cyprinoides]|uniref:RAD9, HUS1, RAD1-interacting nuclear orphan protein 1 n=1 Tax=Megalops cyprinoides TaxID=118141 RepID=UPI00186440A0|nr:RAD9, HUS1, RAD1-interacting nuclear orphan protein 1 [Megalops cyprinoides]